MQTLTTPTDAPVRFTPLLGVWAIALAATVPVFRILPFSNEWVIAAMGLMVAVVLFGQARRPVVYMNWPICAVLVAAGAGSSSGNSFDPESHWIIGAQLILWFGLGPFSARGLHLIDPRVIRWSAIGMITVQTISAGAGVAQAIGITVLDQQAEFGRSPGLAGHPNILGLMAGISIVLCVTEIVDRGSFRLWALGVAVINLGALLASGSISALIASALGMLVLLVAKRLQVRIVLWTFAGGAAALWAVAAFTGASVVDRFMQVTGQTTALATLNLRQETIGYAWEQIQIDPIYGVGLDDYSGGTYNGTTVTHDVLIRAWFQGGIAMGLAFLILFCVLGYLVGKSLIRATNGPAAAVIVIVGGFALTAASFQQGYFWLPILGAIATYVPGHAHHLDQKLYG